VKIEKQWNAYVTWYNLLASWASTLVEEHTARRLARYSLAETFLKASTGMPTEDGPYMASVDVLYGMLARERMPFGREFSSKIFCELPRPDSTMLYRFAELYAMAYSSVYIAQLTLHQRQHMVVLIRCNDPQLMTEYQLGERYGKIDSHLHPLRCVVEAAQEHDCGEEIICSVSRELWREEHLKGLRWLGEGGVDQAGETCPTSVR
jgi:hypothetical protein